jgi:hypothetical protein
MFFFKWTSQDLRIHLWCENALRNPFLQYTSMIYIYSQTCIKRSPLEYRKSGLLRQVTSWKTFNSYEIFYDKTRKRWLLNRGDLMDRLDCTVPPVLSPTSPIAKILVCPDFPPLKIPHYTAKLSYRHPSQVFRHKSHKTNLNSPVSTAHNYLLTAVYWSVIMECQN